MLKSSQQIPASLGIPAPKNSLFSKTVSFHLCTVMRVRKQFHMEWKQVFLWFLPNGSGFCLGIQKDQFFSLFHITVLKITDDSSHVPQNEPNPSLLFSMINVLSPPSVPHIKWFSEALPIETTSSKLNPTCLHPSYDMCLPSEGLSQHLRFSQYVTA